MKLIIDYLHASLIKKGMIVISRPFIITQFSILNADIYSAAITVISTNSSGRANADSPQARAGG